MNGVPGCATDGVALFSRIIIARLAGALPGQESAGDWS
jgi:hypothetical protein